MHTVIYRVLDNIVLDKKNRDQWSQ